MKIKFYNSFNLSIKFIVILFLEWCYNVWGGNICIDYVYDIYGFYVIVVN